MEYHLERRLRLHAEPEYKNLYSWAINEIDEHGIVVGRDQIPWGWTLSFTAISCVLVDGIELELKSQPEEDTKLSLPDISQSQVIHIKLRPERRSDDGDYFHETTYSMFGTDRTIKEFQLDIHPISGSTDHESCRAWGSPSFAVEIDFRNQTVDDCISFYFFVKPETFARYAAKISHGLVDEIILSVGSVDGFYSEWTPSISTRDVKILTRGEQHKVEAPEDIGFEPPRLGTVGDAKFYINRHLEFGIPASDEEGLYEESGDLGTVRIASETRTQAPVFNPKVLKTIASLKRAAWWIVVLLALIFVATLLKR